MPRIRTVKPEAPQHRKLGRVSDRAFRLWLTMLTQADDEGRLSADPGQLRLLTFGYFPEVTEVDVAGALGELSIMGWSGPTQWTAPRGFSSQAGGTTSGSPIRPRARSPLLLPYS